MRLESDATPTGLVALLTLPRVGAVAPTLGYMRQPLQG